MKNRYAKKPACKNPLERKHPQANHMNSPPFTSISTTFSPLTISTLPLELPKPILYRSPSSTSPLSNPTPLSNKLARSLYTLDSLNSSDCACSSLVDIYSALPISSEIKNDTYEQFENEMEEQLGHVHYLTYFFCPSTYNPTFNLHLSYSPPPPYSSVCQMNEYTICKCFL
ncbi:hypothetical protein HMI54_001423 [Coelomomyces lativittatus]|nr:hypothetical protein HMI54_001423 [Coelomomyces lativittatus]